MEAYRTLPLRESPEAHLRRKAGAVIE